MAHSNGFSSSSPYQPRKRSDDHYFGAGGSSSRSSSGKSRRDQDRLYNLGLYAARAARLLWSFAWGRGRRMALAGTVGAAHQLRRNLSARRLLSFPHAVVLVWVFVMLWGERWVFHSTVERCGWDRWEQWPKGAQPHHLVFVADPQLIDPHSYPGRPWPLASLTVTITDNYLRKSYTQLQRQLRPDTVFFLGDLFDGGREWKTAQGEFEDPSWGRRPENEQKHAKYWRKKYGENYWLQEYERFGDIFFDPWAEAGNTAGKGQRGRKLVASLPGNHDLGFGSEIQLPVRDRFEAYFGEGNRVDVIGNHTFVSVDTVSLSADTSEDTKIADLKTIYQPAQWFLNGVEWNKKKAIARELRFQRGAVEEPPFQHRIEELDKANFDDLPSLEGEAGQADLPTVLLSHVPLYRPPGTPCGPMREHWPPAKPPKGQTEPVAPDHRNAITVTKGYQYQNVLSEEDSQTLVSKVGNVVHAFSGDDHDYCEVVHGAERGRVREITVKSISMAMGIPTPGFVMVSLWNPVDGKGNRLPGAPERTLQTHLCLLPNQIATYGKYAALVLVSLAAVAIRAFLVPVLELQPFALEPLAAGGGGGGEQLLPLFNSKAKREDSEYGREQHHSSGASGSMSAASGGYASSRGLAKGGNNNNNGYAVAQAAKAHRHKHNHHHHHQQQPGTGGGGGGSKAGGANRWGWGAADDRGGGSAGPKIEIRSDDDYVYDGGKWKAASSSSSRARGGRGRAGLPSGSALRVVGRETWTSIWRVAWMVVLFWGWLTWRG